MADVAGALKAGTGALKAAVDFCLVAAADLGPSRGCLATARPLGFTKEEESLGPSRLGKVKLHRTDPVIEKIIIKSEFVSFMLLGQLCAIAPVCSRDRDYHIQRLGKKVCGESCRRQG